MSNNLNEFTFTAINAVVNTTVNIDREQSNQHESEVSFNPPSSPPTPARIEPQPYFLPNLLHFGGEVVDQIGIPTLHVDQIFNGYRSNHNKQQQHLHNQPQAIHKPSDTNLVHDGDHVADVTRAINFYPELDLMAENINSLMSLANVSYLSVNSVGHSLKKYDWTSKPTTNSNLMNNLLAQQNAISPTKTVAATGNANQSFFSPQPSKIHMQFLSPSQLLASPPPVNLGLFSPQKPQQLDFDQDVQIPQISVERQESTKAVETAPSKLTKQVTRKTQSSGTSTLKKKKTGRAANKVDAAADQENIEPSTTDVVQPTRRESTEYVPEVKLQAEAVTERLEHLIGKAISTSESTGSVPTKIIAKLQTEIAVASKHDFLKNVNEENLIRLLATIEKEIRKSERFYEQDEYEDDTLCASFDASLLTLSVMTASNMSKQIFLEESIDAIIDLIKYTLKSVIYPVATKYSDTTAKRTAKQKKIDEKQKMETIGAFMDSTCQVLNSMTKLLAAENLQERHVTSLSDLSISTFFVEGIDAIQLSALDLARTVFSKYDSQRDFIINEIILSVLKLPKDKRANKSYLLKDDKSIHMFSALMFQLLQSCVPLPSDIATSVALTPVDVADNAVDHGEDSTAEANFSLTESISLQNILTESWASSTNCARKFILLFLERCAVKTVDEDGLPILEYFLDDLLTVLHSAEWPVADLVLSVLCTTSIKEYLATNSEKEESPNKDATKSTMAAKDKEKIRKFAVDMLGRVAKHIRLERIALLDSEKAQDTSAMDNGFDIDGAGIYSNPDEVIENDPFFKELRAVVNGEADDVVRSKYKVFLYLSSISDANPSALYARQFIISQWCRDEEQTQFHLKLWSKAPQELSSSIALERQEIEKIYKNLEGRRKTSLLNSFESLLRRILLISKDETTSVRTKAIKALTNLIEIDPRILEMEEVQKAIAARSCDPMISVRESVVELVGQSMISLPKLIDNDSYRRLILTRVMDSGQTVRKRSMMILGDLCKLTNNEKLITEICLALTNRLVEDENDNNKELAIKIFKELWFTRADATSIGKSILQIVDVVSASSTNTSLNPALLKDYWLVQILNKLFEQDAESKKKKDSQSPSEICNKMCKCLIDYISRLSSNTDTPDNPKKELGRYSITSCMETLYIFCIVNPTLLVDHIKIVAPFLRSTDNIVLVNHVASILDLVFPLITRHSIEESLINIIINNLMVVIGQIPIEAIRICIKCLCSVVKMASMSATKQTPYQAKINSLLEALYIKLRQPDGTNPANARALTIIGFMCRYYDFDNDTTAEFKSFQKGRIMDWVNQVFLHIATTAQNDLIKQQAIQGLGSLWIRKPSFMMSAGNLIQSCLMSNAETIKAQVLRNLVDFLLEEEATHTIATTTTSVASKNKRLANNTAHTEVDNGISNTVAQQHLKSILRLLFDQSRIVRYHALQVVEISLRQGLVPPLACIPGVVAMESDPELKMHAHAILISLKDRYLNFIVSGTLSGILSSYKLQKIIEATAQAQGATFTVCGTTSPKSTESLYSRFYQSIIQPTPTKERRKFFDLLFRETDKMTDIMNRKYLLEVIAYLPFISKAEVLYVVHLASKMVDAEGDSCLSAMKGFLQQRHDQAADDDDDDDATAASETSKKQEDVEAIKSKALYICMLLQLQYFLKNTYQLKPHEKWESIVDTKAGEKAVSRSPTMLPTGFDAALATYYKEDITEFYNMFRQLHNGTFADVSAMRKAAAAAAAKEGGGGAAPAPGVATQKPARGGGRGGKRKRGVAEVAEEVTTTTTETTNNVDPSSDAAAPTPTSQEQQQQQQQQPSSATTKTTRVVATRTPTKPSAATTPTPPPPTTTRRSTRIPTKKKLNTGGSEQEADELTTVATPKKPKRQPVAKRTRRSKKNRGDDDEDYDNDDSADEDYVANE